MKNISYHFHLVIVIHYRWITIGTVTKPGGAIGGMETGSSAGPDAILNPEDDTLVHNGYKTHA